MALVSQVNDLAVRVAQEFNAVRNEIGAMGGSIEAVNVFASNDISVYADSAVAPMEDPNGRSGWHFRNAVAGQKINWYPWGNGEDAGATYGAVTSVWAVITFYDERSYPYPAFYSKRLGDGQDASSWYRSRWVHENYSATPVAGTKYLVYFGTDPQVYKELPRIELTDTVNSIDRGPRNSAEVLLTYAWGTDSAQGVDEENWTMHVLGHSINGVDFAAPLVHIGATAAEVATKANSGDVYTKAEVDTAIATAISGLVDGAPDALNTLNELAAALNDDASAVATLTTQIAAKADQTAVDAVAADVAAIETDLGAGYATADFVAAFEAEL